MIGKWWRKLRGLTGLTVIGGIIGGVLGSAYLGVFTLLAGGPLTLELMVMGEDPLHRGTPAPPPSHPRKRRIASV